MALIGDIRGSREADDRAELQERFRGAMERVEGEFAYSLAYPPTITTGDEFQGLFSDPHAARHAISFVSDLMAPTMLRFGLGYGTLEAEPSDPRQAIDLDGPCLRQARRALEDAKNEEGWVRAVGFGPGAPPDSSLDGEEKRVQEEPWRRDALSVDVGAILDGVGALRSLWTERQAQVVQEFRKGKSGREVAEALGLAPSTVSEHRKAARYDAVRDSEAAFGRFLDTLIQLSDHLQDHAPEEEEP